MRSKIDKAEYLLRSKLDAYQQLQAELMRTLSRELDESSYVSFSAGKDSSVIAHACHAVYPGIPILMSDGGCPVRWMEYEREMWLQYAAAQGWNLHLFPWDKFSTIRTGGTVKQYQQRSHNAMFRDLTAWAHERGYIRNVMGLRAEESRTRRISFAVHGCVNHKRICPLADWRTADVWTYIISHGLPWLSIYDYVGPDARNGLIGRSGVEQGRHVYLKLYYPEVYRQARELMEL